MGAGKGEEENQEEEVQEYEVAHLVDSELLRAIHFGETHAPWPTFASMAAVAVRRNVPSLLKAKIKQRRMIAATSP